MYSVTNMSTGVTSEVNFEQLSSEVDESLDEAFFTEVFVAHTLTGKTGQLVVMKE